MIEEALWSSRNSAPQRQVKIQTILFILLAFYTTSRPSTIGTVCSKYVLEGKVCPKPLLYPVLINYELRSCYVVACILGSW